MWNVGLFLILGSSDRNVGLFGWNQGSFKHGVLSIGMLGSSDDICRAFSKLGFFEQECTALLMECTALLMESRALSNKGFF